MANKMVLCPDGMAVNLDEIRCVSRIYYIDNNVGLTFYLYYKGISGDIRFTFNYKYDRYTDSKNELLVKVQNIRAEILKRINDGTEAKEIMGAINLKKKKKKKKDG